jgi:DNA-binding NtrC family response regulator
LSESSCILVVGATEAQVSTAVAALREAGWNAVGTADPWEAISLVSRRSFALILQDQEMAGFGALDFSTIVSGDPVLQDIPAIRYSGIDLELPRLLMAVENALHPRFPSDEPSLSDTRFVRRRRPAMVPAIG